VRKIREKFVRTGDFKCIIRELGTVDLSFKNIRKVMVVTDGSDCGSRAAEYGLSIAKLVDAQITVVYVVDEVVLDIVSKGTKREEAELELRREGQRCIDYVLELAKKEGIEADSLLAKLAQGRPYEQIVHVANQLKIDLIVMGTSAERRGGGVLLAGVVGRVIQYASCPVLVVR
jgi:nucleotide-binding universal stress UspA family protein